LTQPDFEEPWQAEALALAMALIDTGRITKMEWTQALGCAIKRAELGRGDDGSHYYDHVLEALENLAVGKALTTGQALSSRKAAWVKAYASTPHGQPVVLRHG
jgi:nitrile hydratase accessory protein